MFYLQNVSVHEILIGLYWQFENTLRRERFCRAIRVSASWFFYQLLFKIGINTIRINFAAKVCIHAFLSMCTALRVSLLLNSSKCCHLLAKRFVSQSTWKMCEEMLRKEKTESSTDPEPRLVGISQIYKLFYQNLFLLAAKCKALPQARNLPCIPGTWIATSASSVFHLQFQEIKTVFELPCFILDSQNFPKERIFLETNISQWMDNVLHEFLAELWMVRWLQLLFKTKEFTAISSWEPGLFCPWFTDQRSAVCALLLAKYQVRVS